VKDARFTPHIATFEARRIRWRTSEVFTQEGQGGFDANLHMACFAYSASVHRRNADVPDICVRASKESCRTLRDGKPSKE